MTPMHQTSAPPPARDARTTDVLFSSFGGRLFAYFQLMLGSESGAKRALTDTLMAATADAGSAGRPRDLDSYAPRLFALARTECHKYQSAEAVGAGQHWTVGDGLGGNPMLAEVARRAVARLAPDVREAYILSAPHNGLSLPQLAEVLGVGLDTAADLRAQAGLDFVRAVALCAQEASFIQFSGAELRIRAEESLAADAAKTPPPLAMLSDPALAAFRDSPREDPSREAVGPSRQALALPAAEPFGSPAGDFRGTEGTRRGAAGPPHPSTPPPTRADLSRPAGFPGGPDYDRGPGYNSGQGYDSGPDYGSGPGYDSGPGYGRGPDDAYERTGFSGARGYADSAGGSGFGRAPGSFGGWSRLTGPLRALTGPMQFGDEPADGGRRRGRVVLAWVGGGVAAVAVAVIAGQVLSSGSGNTITLTHGGGPASTAPFSPGVGAPMATPRATRPSATGAPSSSQLPVNGAGVPSATSAGIGGQASGAASNPAARASTGASPKPAAPVSPSPKPTPDPAPTTPSAPATVPQTSSAPASPPDTTSSSPPATQSS